MDRFGVKPNDERYPNYATKIFLVTAVVYKTAGQCTKCRKAKSLGVLTITISLESFQSQVFEEKIDRRFCGLYNIGTNRPGFSKNPYPSLADVFPGPVLLGGQAAPYLSLADVFPKPCSYWRPGFSKNPSLGFEPR